MLTANQVFSSNCVVYTLNAKIVRYLITWTRPSVNCAKDWLDRFLLFPFEANTPWCWPDLVWSILMGSCLVRKRSFTYVWL